MTGNLDLTLAGIEKQFGKGAVMRLGDINIAEGYGSAMIRLCRTNLVGGYPYA